MNTNDAPERLSPAASSVKAAQIVTDLLANPYPYDLMEIRRDVNTYASETSAMADLETYCTEAFALKKRAGWQAAQDAAREWLSSQSAGGMARELAAQDSATPCRAACRLDLTIFAILCMYEAEELTEGQAVKLMNCQSRVEFRLLREKLHRNFRVSLAADMTANGWEWQNKEISDG